MYLLASPLEHRAIHGSVSFALGTFFFVFILKFNCCLSAAIYFFMTHPDSQVNISSALRLLSMPHGQR